MGPIDTYIVYRFIRLLTTPWDETDAFKNGVIDATGEMKVGDGTLTPKQKASYTLFDKLVFNVKRLIERVPGGKSKIGTYAAALFLMKEELGDQEGKIVLEHSFMSYLKENDAIEGDYLAEQHLLEEMLPHGRYKLKDRMLDTEGHIVPKATIVVATSSMKPLSRVLGVDVYALKIANKKTMVVVSREDIESTLSEDELPEDAPTNNAGSGNIAGLGVGPQGEPGVSPNYQRKRKQLKLMNGPAVDPRMFADKIFTRNKPS